MMQSLLAALNNQRLLSQYCDIVIKLEEQPGEVCAHFCVVAARSKFLGGPQFQQKLQNFSIKYPLVFTIKHFECFPCVQAMVELFYENSITISEEHKSHMQKLTKIFDVDIDPLSRLDGVTSFDKHSIQDEMELISDTCGSQHDCFKNINATTPNLCPHCGKGFKWKQGLSSHLLIHSKEKQMLCDVCGYSTTHMKALKAHKLQHNGEFFKCTFPGCMHRSNRKENLKMHMETHKRERPFVCEVCGCKFSQNKNLKRHALKHSIIDGVKKFKCQLCSFSSYRSDNLREHVQRLHTEKALQLELPETVESSFEIECVNDEFNLPEICLTPDVCANKSLCDAPFNAVPLNEHVVKTISKAEDMEYVRVPSAKCIRKRQPRCIAPKPPSGT